MWSSGVKTDISDILAEKPLPIPMESAKMAENSLKTVIFSDFPGFDGFSRSMGFGKGFGNVLSKIGRKSGQNVVS